MNIFFGYKIDMFLCENCICDKEEKILYGIIMLRVLLVVILLLFF